MQKDLREIGAKALGQPLFTDSVKQKFCTQSHYLKNEELLNRLQRIPRILATYSFAPHHTGSRQRNAAFQTLRLTQLEEALQNTEGNARLHNYCSMIHAFHTATYLEGNRLRALINKTESKLVKELDSEGVSRQDIRNFIMVSVMFGDKDFFYDQELIEEYKGLCAKI